MTVYRASQGQVVPDDDLSKRLAWLEDAGENPQDALIAHQFRRVVNLGDEFRWVWYILWRDTNSDGLLVNLKIQGDHYFIWCEHMGELLMLQRWLVPMVAEAKHL